MERGGGQVEIVRNVRRGLISLLAGAWDASCSAALMAEPSLKHPPGLKTLFFTEMWERWSFYGMRALLVGFMSAAAGLGMTAKDAAAVYGLYLAVVYCSALPGGWIGDRLLGPKRAVWWGGVIIAFGHLMLALEGRMSFLLGLLVIAIGSGLLKSNMSALVGLLYPEGGQRRDAGFTIFYFGINVGAFFAPLVSGWLRDSASWGWKWAFASATAGMFIGLLQFQLSRRLLDGVGDHPQHPGQNVKREWQVFWAGLSSLVVLTALCACGVIVVDAVWLAKAISVAILAAAGSYYVWLLFFAGLLADEKARIVLSLIFFFTSALFFAGFEQSGSSFNIFADKNTDRVMFGYTVPAEWFQAVNPLFVIALAPVMAWMWQWLDRRGFGLSLTAKMGWAMLLLGGGFMLAVLMARHSLSVGQVSPLWLLGVYFFLTVGELCLSPVGLSAFTKLSPARYTAQMMGIWFLGTSLGDVISGLIAGHVSGDAMAEMPAIFMKVVWLSLATGGVLLLFAKPIQKLARGVS